MLNALQMESVTAQRNKELTKKTKSAALRSWRKYQEARIDGVELRVPFRDCAQYLTDLFLLRINFKSVSKTKPQMIFFINVTLTLLMWICYASI